MDEEEKFELQIPLSEFLELTFHFLATYLYATMESKKRPRADDAELAAQPKKRVVTSPGVGASPYSVANGISDAVPEPTADEQLEVGSHRVDVFLVSSNGSLRTREREKSGAYRTTGAAQKYL